MTSSAWTVEDLDARARELPKPDQARLVALLLRELIPVDPAIEAAWLDEAQRRDRELELDPEQALDSEDVFRRVRANLRW